MLYWEKLTRQANQAYSNQAFLEAVDFNQQALGQVQKSFDDDFRQDPESAVAAAVVSYLNIAESYTGLGNFIAANEQYENAINFLQAAIVRPDLAADQRDLIMQTANHVRFEWELFVQSHGQDMKTHNKILVGKMKDASSSYRVTTFH